MKLVRQFILWVIGWTCVIGWLVLAIRSLSIDSSSVGSGWRTVPLADAVVSRYTDDKILNLFEGSMTVRVRVLDQDAVPVANANLEVVVQRFHEPDERVVWSDLQTDELGRFEIPGVRATQVYFQASSEGYQRVGKRAGGGNGSSVSVGQFDAEARGSNGLREVVIRLHRLNPTRTITHHRLRRYVQVIGHAPMVVEIPAGDVGDPVSDRILIEVSVPDPEDLERLKASRRLLEPFDWSHRVTVPGGGLVVVDDFIGLTAPEEGYIRVDRVHFEERQQYWHYGFQRRYFVRLPSGRYAAIVMDSELVGGSWRSLVQMWVNEEPGDRELSGGRVPLW